MLPPNIKAGMLWIIHLFIEKNGRHPEYEEFLNFNREYRTDLINKKIHAKHNENRLTIYESNPEEVKVEFERAYAHWKAK